MMDTMRNQRQDLVTARETLRRADAGQDSLDFATAASMVDRVLATSCPHDASTHHTAPDGETGYDCGVSWYADSADRLPG